MTIHSQNGFTLVEMAIVMFIMALMLGSGLTLMSVQQDQRYIDDTKARLAQASEALMGFAIAYGRLPCPASATSSGMEIFCTNATGTCGALLTTYQTHGRCFNPYDGFLPAATLGLSGTDNTGFAIDSWRNHIHYAVSASNDHAFTTNNGMKSIGIANLNPDLLVCESATATGFDGSNCGTNNGLTASPGVPAVLYSTGKNGAYGGTGTDEAVNPNPNSTDNNRTFVSHTITAAKDSPANGEFDDQVIWISPYILFNRMVQSGKLP